MSKLLRDQLQTEVDTSFFYQLLSEQVEDKGIADIYRKMSEIEGSHAKRILAKLQADNPSSSMPGPSRRAKIQARISKIFGYEFLVGNLLTTEEQMARSTISQKKKSGEKVSGSELNHVKILSSLAEKTGGTSGGILAKIEGRHRSVGGNALRAAVLGANDGLVSNLSLIMGVAGATSGNNEIVIAGFAGLLAGAISMALGEWLSVQSSRELLQRQIAIEAEELENSPEEEAMELALIYQAKGMDAEHAKAMADKVLENKETALENLVREELNIDMEELGGSAWVAAVTSFVLFALGAILPLLPFLFSSGNTATMASLVISTLGLFLIGAAITLFTGRGVLYSGLRQVFFGLAAAAVTYGIGSLVGMSIAG